MRRCCQLAAPSNCRRGRGRPRNGRCVCVYVCVCALVRGLHVGQRPAHVCFLVVGRAHFTNHTSLKDGSHLWSIPKGIDGLGMSHSGARFCKRIYSAGISGKSQILFAIVYFTRCVPLCPDAVGAARPHLRAAAVVAAVHGPRPRTRWCLAVWPNCQHTVPMHGLAGAPPHMGRVGLARLGRNGVVPPAPAPACGRALPLTLPCRDPILRCVRGWLAARRVRTFAGVADTSMCLSLSSPCTTR